MAGYNFSKDREKAKDRLRLAVIEAAAEILALGGKDALSARKLTAAVGASTKIIYSHFGGMPGVIAGVYAAAFERLAASMTAADDPEALIEIRLHATARAYRRFALDNHTLFELMFGSRSRELVPERSDREAATASLRIFIQIFESVDRYDSPRALASSYQLWAAIHGPVSLEVSAWLKDDEAFEGVLAMSIAALR